MNLLDFSRRRHVLDNRIQKRLDTLVLESRTAKHRNDFIRQRLLAQPADDFLGRQFAVLEVLLHKLFGGLGSGLNQLLVSRLGFVCESRRDVSGLVSRAHVIGIPIDSTHFHEVDHAFEILFSPDGQLNRHRARAQALLDLLDDSAEVGTHAIHLVDKCHAGHGILRCLTPHGFGLRLHAGNGAEHSDGTVEHAQRALNFDGEVDVARGVDDIDAVFGPVLVHPLPEAGGGRGRNGDATLLLLLHPVHDSIAIMHLAQLVGDAGIEQNALGRRGLAGIDVGHDADIPIALDGCFA